MANGLHLHLSSDPPLDQRILTEGTLFTPEEMQSLRGEFCKSCSPTGWGLLPGVAQDTIWAGLCLE